MKKTIIMIKAMEKKKKEDIQGFEFNIKKKSIKCTDAIDLPDNQYGVMVYIDIMDDLFGIVRQNEIIGSCKGTLKMRELYKKAKVAIRLNISKINWVDEEEELYFKVSAKTVSQIPYMQDVGDVIASEFEFRIESTGDKDPYHYKNSSIVGKSLENKDELFSRIKNLIYSKFV